jgi:hypothetical protein
MTKTARASKAVARGGSRPSTASGGGALILRCRAIDPEIAEALPAAAARLGIEIAAGRTPIDVAPHETLAHQLRVEVLSQIDGSIDLGATASARARSTLEGLVGRATSRSVALLRESKDGRLLLSLRDRLPIDLGEPPEARAAIEAAKARRATSTTAPTEPIVVPASAEARARAITFGPTRVLSDPSSRRVLEAFGVASTPWRLAENAARAAAHARAIGYPVDLRIASPDVSAIDDPALSAIELRTPGEVREGFRSIVREQRRRAPPARSLGVTVARHVGGTPRLRVALDPDVPRSASATARLRIELDDPIGRRLTRPISLDARPDPSAIALALARFDGRDVLPRGELPLGRALIATLARFTRLSQVLADTLTGAEIAPLAPVDDGWVVLGARLSVRGVDPVTGS